MSAIQAEVAPVREVRISRRRRERTFIAVLVALVIVVSMVSLAVGASVLSIPEVFATLLGQGTSSHEFVVLTLRLPRLTMAILVGATFALSGVLFQTMLRNPLASPDMIGITGGASAAAVSAILLLGLSGFSVSLAAFLGALGVAAITYLLSWRAGLAGYRFVLVGIGLAFLITGIIGYLLTRADVRDAQAALVWMVGSLSATRWPDVAIAALCLALLVPLVAVAASRLRILQLGDDTATGLGLPTNRTRLLVLLLAVALAAVGTAAVGPLAFVAFVSAPIARRALGGGGLALVPTAFVGILLVTVADLAAQNLFPGTKLPVGIVTGAVGAPYLLWLLARTGRQGGAL